MIQFQVEFDLFGDHCLSAYHSGLASPIVVAAKGDLSAWREMERQLVQATKKVCLSYLSVVKHSKARGFDSADREALETTIAKTKRIARSMRILTAQRILQSLLPELRRWMSHHQSRLFASQQAKLQFLEDFSELNHRNIKNTNHGMSNLL